MILTYLWKLVPGAHCKPPARSRLVNGHGARGLLIDIGQEFHVKALTIENTIHCEITVRGEKKNKFNLGIFQIAKSGMPEYPPEVGSRQGQLTDDHDHGCSRGKFRGPAAMFCPAGQLSLLLRIIDNLTATRPPEKMRQIP